jgi:hypothetical protein
MKIHEKISTLPWTGTPVRVISNLTDYFGETILDEDSRYLPSIITLFVDAGINEQCVADFIDCIGDKLKNELHARKERTKNFIALGLFEPAEIESILVEHNDVQPWAIHYGLHGGLGVERASVRTREVPRGVIPCSSMRNHGVAWEPSDNDGINVWLATSRKEEEDWDWDSDICHESSHAAFAPVPLFVQSANLLKGMLHVDNLASANDLQPRHIARIVYAFSEVAVFAVRGELRETETGTPIGQKEELLALLRLSHELMPELGFDRAISVYEQSPGFLDTVNGSEIYEIAAPMMRAIPKFKGIMKSFFAPTVDEFRAIFA